MKAYRAETIGGLTQAIAEVTKAANDLLKDGKVALIELKENERGRTAQQNRLQRKWMSEAAEQGDMTAEEFRGLCKLHIGVPMLREADEHFRAEYDRVIKPLPYEIKLACMMEPFDFSVTRLMKVKMKAQYLDQVYVYLTGLGFKLTEPEKG